MSICKLCHRDKPLKNSHLFPQFISDWIRDTSLTGKFRTAINPNLRVQDTETEKLLCKDCEDLFSVFEKYFSENIFKPVLNDNNTIIDYDFRLLKFVVSISWRILIIHMLKYQDKFPKHKIAAQKAEERWREFLLQKLDLNGYEHHILMLQIVPDAPIISGTGADINWYFFRTLDGTIIQNSTEAFVYSKLPGFVLLSPIIPGQKMPITGTLIKTSGKMYFCNQKPSPEFFKFLRKRFEEALLPLKFLSTKQKDKIKADYYKNVDKAQDSFGFKIFLTKEEFKNRNKHE